MKTADGQAFDPKTGEVLEPSRRGARGRPVRTPEEQAEAKRVRKEHAELRRQEVAMWRSLNPACETAEDPPVVWRRPARMGGEPATVLLDVPRLSGRGLPGSRFVIGAREYDGAGPNGGDAHEYLTAFVSYLLGGYRWRWAGTAIRSPEALRSASTIVRWFAAVLARSHVGLAQAHATTLLRIASDLDAIDGDLAGSL